MNREREREMLILLQAFSLHIRSLILEVESLVTIITVKQHFSGGRKKKGREEDDLGKGWGVGVKKAEIGRTNVNSILPS